MKKKPLSIILAILMILVTVPVAVSADAYDKNETIVATNKGLISGSYIDEGEHFEVAFSLSDADGWDLSDKEGYNIKISAKNDEKITKIIFTIGYVINSKYIDTPLGTESISASAGEFVPKNPIQVNDQVTLNIADPVDEVTIRWISVHDFLSIKQATIYYEGPHEHDDIKFDSAIEDSVDLGYLFTNGGNGYLANDIVLDGSLTVAPNKTVHLCLNGHVIDLDSYHLTVTGSGTFSIYDCGTLEHKFGDNNGLWIWNDSLDGDDIKHTVIGGCITNGYNSSNGGAISVYGTFGLNAGNIVGNRTDSYGGGLNVTGVITAFKGGMIAGNTAASNGGGVHISGTNSGTVSVRGSMKIVDNYIESGAESNVNINSNQKLTIYEPVEDMEIGITLGGPTDPKERQITIRGSESYVDRFFVDGGGYVVTYNDNGTEDITDDFLETKKAYTVDISANDDAFGSPKASKNPAAAGSTVTLTANPKDGYCLDQWQSADVEITNNQFTMPSKDVSIIGIYAESVAAVTDFDGNRTCYSSLTKALEKAKELDTVELLKDIPDSADDITVGEMVIFDLNDHVLKTTGNIVNNGGIVLYSKNADIIDYLLYNVPGNYMAGEDLVLGSDYKVPEGTVAWAETGKSPNYQELLFAMFGEMLEWNVDVKKGTQLDVTDDLALGGDIIAPTDENDMDTNVKTTRLKLNDDIALGSNDKNDGSAILTIESYDSIDDSRVKGEIDANGHKITLNRTGILVVSADAEIDESIIEPGADGMIVHKEYDGEEEAFIYTIGFEHYYTNEPFSVFKGYSKDLEFVTNAETWTDSDVVIKVDGKILESSDYDLTHGSLHISLHGDYIKKLDVGKHTLTTAVTDYATISQDFYIKALAPSYVAPKTGIE